MLPADLQALALAGAYLAGTTLAFTGNRTMLHVATGNLAWFALLFEDPWVPFLGALALAGLAALARAARFAPYLEALASERDAGPVVFFLAFAAVGALWVAGLPRAWVLFALLPMAFADPVGFYVGRAWGRHRLPNGKSVEGAVAVFAASLAVTTALAGALGGAWPVALAAALGATLGEVLAPRHLDNLLMPLGAVGLGVGAAGLLSG